MTEPVDTGQAKVLAFQRGLANRLAALRKEAARLSADLRMTVSRYDRPHKTFVQGFGAAIEMMETVHTTDELAEFVENLKRQLDNDSQA